jgi:KaiC/GvpD/RAD55 family RecA-like ATPase
MKSAPLSAASASKKTASGIAGYGELTGGGLPHGLSTLLAGGSGFGKTIFALRLLVDGARDFKEPGIFVAFEESPKRIVASLQGFSWNAGIGGEAGREDVVGPHTASHKNQITKGRRRLRQLRGRDLNAREPR